MHPGPLWLPIISADGITSRLGAEAQISCSPNR